MEKVAGPIKKARPMILKGWNRTEEAYPTIYKDEPDDRVLGVLYEVTEDQLQKLDNWESAYNRELLAKRLNELIWVYIKKPRKNGEINNEQQ
jgi:gamma-glutamylcyclotransferase (GGCT)/AIG2-like uncharacterized protein YtfP